MELIATVLAFLVASFVVITLEHYQLSSMQGKELKLIVAQVATQQVTFAHAVEMNLEQDCRADFLARRSRRGGGVDGEHEQDNPAQDTVLTVQDLETAGDLPPHFPATNELGQTPIAYIGAQSTALVTYTTLPDANIAEALGLNTASAQSMSGLCAKLILQASAAQEAYASALVAVGFTNDQAVSPYGGQSVALGTFFKGYPQVTEPLFAEIVNLDAAYSGAEIP